MLNSFFFISSGSHSFSRPVGDAQLCHPALCPIRLCPLGVDGSVCFQKGCIWEAHGVFWGPSAAICGDSHVPAGWAPSAAYGLCSAHGRTLCARVVSDLGVLGIKNAYCASRNGNGDAAMSSAPRRAAVPQENLLKCRSASDLPPTAGCPSSRTRCPRLPSSSRRHCSFLEGMSGTSSGC